MSRNFKPYSMKPSSDAVNNHRSFKGNVSNFPSNKPRYAKSNKFQDYTPSDSSDSEPAAPPPAPVENRPPARSYNNRNNNNNRNNRNFNNQNRNANSYTPKKNQHNDKPRDKPYQAPPPPRPVAYIDLIPCHFNSYQVRMLADQLWEAGNIPELQGLLHFFETLRKAIIHMNVKERVEQLDPKYPAMLEALQPTIPEGLNFYSEELTPRPDNSTEYDSDVWAKMFIQMLPRPTHTLPATMEVFKLISELSQQITQSEAAVIRLKLINDSKGPMQRELNALGDLQDRYGWDDAKYQKEESKIIKKWNATMWEKRNAREKEIYAMYDAINDYFNESNVNNFNDRFILGSWRFLLRNPCFPFQEVVINDKVFPASQFSLVEAFNNPLLSYTETFSFIRSWYFSKHPTLNAVKPTLDEFNDWMEVCLFSGISWDLITFLCEDSINISSIANFDHKLYRLISSWINAKYGKPIILKSSSDYTLLFTDDAAGQFGSNSENAYVKSHEIYPYHELRLHEETYENEVGLIINSLTKENFHWKSLLIKSFNHNVIKGRITKSLVSGDCIDVNSTVKFAMSIGIDMNAFSQYYLAEITKKAANPRNTLLHSISCIILANVFNEPIEETFERFYTLFVSNDTHVADFLKGFSLQIQNFPEQCRLLKPRIEKIANDIVSKYKYGAAKYLSVDTLEAFAKLQ